MTPFEELVLKMRTAQKEYEKRKCGSIHQDVKVLERSVDMMLEKYKPIKPADISERQTDLFQ